MKLFKVIKMSKDEESELVESMRQRRGQTNPEVGSFFYDLEKHCLILVDTIPTKYCPTNGGGMKTTDKLHEDIWWENDMPGDFKDTPRGRVFFNTKNNKYKLALGDWAENIQDEILEKVKKRFHLENEPIYIEFGNHWNIGEGFEGRGYDY